MAPHFGQRNGSLTQAIRRVAATSSRPVKFRPHALEAMDSRGFDHTEVMDCLRKGHAYGPEIQNNELRANVIHQGHQIRVVVRGLDDLGEDWSKLESVTVVTVMKA